MDLSKFKTSDWLKVGGGAVFFIAGFLSWWTFEIEGFEGFEGSTRACPASATTSARSASPG